MDKKSPFISVIIPAYNEEKFLPACLESISKQTLAKNEYEVVVVDNASTDRTAEIAKRYPVKLIHEPKRSVTVARQTGVNKSHGNIIVSGDADTFYPPKWLTNIKDTFIKNPELIGVGGWVYFDKTSTFFNFSFAIGQQLNLILQRFTGRFPIVYAANFAFKRSALYSIGGYPVYLPELGDQQYILYRFFKIGKVIINPRVKCITSGRRQNSLSKNILQNVWHRLIGYIINRLFSEEIIGPAPAIRTIQPRRSRS